MTFRDPSNPNHPCDDSLSCTYSLKSWAEVTSTSAATFGDPKEPQTIFCTDIPQLEDYLIKPHGF